MHRFRGHQLNSIHAKLLLVIATCFFSFFALFTFSTIQTAKTVWHKLLDQEQSWLVLQGCILDAFFLDANQYLISLSAEVNDMTLDSRNADDDVVALVYSKLVRILKEYNFLGTIMDGNFIYLDDPQELIAVSSSRTDYAQRQRVRERLTAYMEENKHGSRNWIALETDGEYFLCKIIKVDGGRLGIWVSADTMLRMLNSAKTAPIEHVTIATDDGRILDQSPVFSAVLPEQLSEDRMIRLGDGNRYMPLQYDFSWGSFKLIGWMNERMVMATFSGQLVFFALLTVLLLCLLSVTIFLMKRWFLTPLSTMIAAMNEIRKGRLEQRLDLQNADEEFLLLQTTFNNMMDDITKLKMDVYEARLSRNKLRQQYYNLQIKPHFLANAFNMIYQFAQIQNYAMIQKLVMHLSAFYRYTMDSALDEITVQKELFHIENYLEIQKLRYPKNLETHIDVQQGVENAKLPPLILQVFVENAVRYAISMDDVTVIGLSLCAVEQQGARYLSAVIGDNGPGVPAAILEKLKSGERLFSDGREHIGIYNSMQRLNLIYHGQAKIEIVNLPDRGAEVRILIPYRSDDGGEQSANCG